MKASEKNLEKWVKRIVRGEPVASADLLQYWNGLGVAGDGIIIRLLNRLNGWLAFVAHVTEVSEGRKKLEGIVDRAGVGDAALAALHEIGIDPSPGETARSRAAWVVEAATGSQKEWQRARGVLLSDTRLFDASIDMIEEVGNPSAAAFLESLLIEKLSRDQDHQIRTALYHLKQKGIGASKEESKSLQREFWAFLENRIPGFQAVFCFRRLSGFSDAGELFELTFVEGEKVFPLRQVHFDSMNAVQFGITVEKIAKDFEKNLGVAQFAMVPDGDARFLLQQSLGFLEGKTGSGRLKDFLHFMGPVASSNPLESFKDTGILEGGNLQDHEFFELWFLNPDEFESTLSELEKEERTRIVLPGVSELEPAHEVEFKALDRFFNEEKRRLWSFLLQKAAYYSHHRNEELTRNALSTARQFSNLNLPMHTIPFAVTMMERTAGIIRHAREKEKQTSLIVTPDEFFKK